MKKSEVLVIGCGGCGNRQLEEFLSLDRRYTGIYMNTNMAEMETLKHFDRDRRCFYIPNADGTGKNRGLAEKYIKEEASKFMDMIAKFSGQNHIIFLSSANGGTGSMASIMLPRIIKAKFPAKKITLIATFPNIQESDIDFNNAIDFWNDMIKSRQNGYIDSFMFIDNNKPFTEEDINRRAMKDLDSTFEIVQGKLDSIDVERFHNSEGYKVILNLDNSIDRAKRESVYYVPEKLDCDVMVGSLNAISIPNISSKIDCYGFSKFHTKKEGNSIVALGGCEVPNECIELCQEVLRDISSRKKRRVIQEAVLVGAQKKEQKIEDNSLSRISSSDLEDMFADDNFWD